MIVVRPRDIPIYDPIFDYSRILQYFWERDDILFIGDDVTITEWQLQSIGRCGAYWCTFVPSDSNTSGKLIIEDEVIEADRKYIFVTHPSFRCIKISKRLQSLTRVPTVPRRSLPTILCSEFGRISRCHVHWSNAKGIKKPGKAELARTI